MVTEKLWLMVKQIKLSRKFLNHFFLGIKLGQKQFSSTAALQMSQKLFKQSGPYIDPPDWIKNKNKSNQ